MYSRMVCGRVYATWIPWSRELQRGTTQGADLHTAWPGQLQQPELARLLGLQLPACRTAQPTTPSGPGGCGGSGARRAGGAGRCRARWGWVALRCTDSEARPLRGRHRRRCCRLCGCGRRVGVERGRGTDPTRSRSGPDAPRLGCVCPGAADAPSAPHSAAATGPHPDGAPRRAAAAG